MPAVRFVDDEEADKLDELNALDELEQTEDDEDDDEDSCPDEDLHGAASGEDLAVLPPETRLARLCEQLRALEAQRRTMEITGELWKPADASGGDDPDPELDRGPWGPHGTLTHDILTLKMRRVALCHLTTGTEGAELAEAHVDLATTYAQLGLWAQVQSHTATAHKLLEKAVQRNWVRDAAHSRAEKQWPGGAPAAADEPAWTRPEAEALPMLCRLVLQAADARGALPAGRLRDLLDGHEEVTRLRAAAPALFDALDDAADELPDTAPTSWPALLEGAGRPALEAHAAALERLVGEGAEEQDLLDDARAAFSAARAAPGDLFVDPQTFSDALPAEADLRALFAHRGHPSVGISDPVPLSWAEVASYMFLSSSAPTASAEEESNGTETDVVVLRARMALLTGRFLAHTGRLDEAIRRLKMALSLEQRVPDGPARLHWCELRVAVAEALVMLHEQDVREGERRVRAEAERWLVSDEGHARWREEARRLAASTRTDLGHGLSRREAEALARDPLLKEYAAAARPAQWPEDRLDEAAQYLLQVWQAKERLFGRAHVEVADACAALGSVHLMKQSSSDAAQLLSSALAVFTETVGTAVPTVAALLVQLGRLQRHRGERFLALQYLCSAATFYTDSYNGPSHAEAAGKKAVELWGEVAALCDKPEEAVTAHLQAADVTKLLHGPNSVPVAKACARLGEAYKAAADFEGARAAFMTVRSIYAKKFGRRHPKTKRAAQAVRDAVPPSERVAAREDEPTGDESWLQ